MSLPVAAACTNCRDRKVKCDGNFPCRACLKRKEENACIYLKSRRGGKRKIHGSISTTATPEVELMDDILDRPYTDVDGTMDFDGTVFLDTYYESFHPSHSFLPSLVYLKQTAMYSEYPQLLYPIMSIGARLLGPKNLQAAEHYAELGRQATIFFQDRHDATLPVVQFFLAQSLLNFACDKKPVSIMLLQQACDVAIIAGFFEPQDAPEADQEYSKSLQNTVHELWMCSIMFAALTGQRDGYLDLDTVSSTPSLREAQNLAMSSAEVTINTDYLASSHLNRSKSHLYLLASFDILRQIIAYTNTSERRGHQISQLENLDSRLLLLRSNMPEIVSSPIELDYEALRTRTVLAISTIMLHSSSAQIALPYFIQSPACGINLEKISNEAENSVYSVRRVLSAANDLIRGVKLNNGSVTSGSPHLCCALSISSFIHASAALLGWDDSSASSLQLERLWLRQMGEIWPTASVIADRVDSLVSSFGLFSGLESRADKDSSSTDNVLDIITSNAMDFGL